MIVKRDSWHYKVLAYTSVMRHYLNDPYYVNSRRGYGMSYVDIYEDIAAHSRRINVPKTFCQYIQKVLFIPLYCFLVNVSALSLLLYIAASNVWASTVTILAGLAICLVFLLLVALVIGGTTAVEYASKYLGAKSTDAESFIGQVYKKYHSNICTIIEVKK